MVHIERFEKQKPSVLYSIHIYMYESFNVSRGGPLNIVFVVFCVGIKVCAERLSDSVYLETLKRKFPKLPRGVGLCSRKSVDF